LLQETVKPKLIALAIAMMTTAYALTLEYFYEYAFEVYGPRYEAGDRVPLGNTAPAENVVLFHIAPRIEELLQFPLGGAYFVLRSRLRSDHSRAKDLYFTMLAKRQLERSDKDDLESYIRVEPGQTNTRTPVTAPASENPAAETSPSR
jgi:hypothetical protein